MKTKHLLPILLALAIGGCVADDFDELGTLEQAIFFEDGDAAEVPGYQVFIRLIGRHPTADPTGPGFIDYDSYSDYDGHYCGGVLIADNWVLTASHCLYKAFPTGASSAARYLMRLDQFEVVHGKLTLNGANTQSVQRRYADLYQFHPSSYPQAIGTEIEQTNWWGMDWQCQMPMAPFGDDQANLTTWHHDLALIRLSQPFHGVSPVKVSSTLNPLPKAEPYPHEPTPEGSMAKSGDQEGAASDASKLVYPQQSGLFHGWGRTRNLVYIPILGGWVWVDQTRSNALRYYAAKPVALSACDPAMLPFIDASEFCLKANNGQGTVSLGDSGGPFVINNQLVGIAHAGVQSSSGAQGSSIMTSGPVAKPWVDSAIASGGTQYAPAGCPNIETSAIDDCRVNGCAEHEHCQACPDYVCLPSNQACY